MKTYLAKRLLLMVPTLLGMTFLTYAIVRLSPGEPIEAWIRAQTGGMDPVSTFQQAEKIRARLGLKDHNYWGDDVETHLETLEKGGDAAKGRAAAELERITGQTFARDIDSWKKWWDAYRADFEKTLIDPLEKALNVFHGYGTWVAHAVRGDLGKSIKFETSITFRTPDGGQSPSGNPFWLFAERVPVTLTLNVIAELLIFLIAIPVGLTAARYRGRLFDRTSTFLLLALWSIPAILMGTLFIALLCRGGQGLEWFPVSGLHSDDADKLGWGAYLADLLWHAALPVVCLVYGGLAYLAKLGRASLLENLRADFVRTARAKGLPERRVVYHHALRNSLLPMITTMVMILPAMIGGSVIVESLFSIRGMGLLVVDGAKAHDIPVIMFGTVLYGFLTLVALLGGDVLYAWADPRVRYE